MFRVFPGALLLAGACSLCFAANDSALLALAPAGSQVVAAVSVDGSRNSSFGQFLLRQLSVHNDEFEHMVEQTGFDPRRDLQFLLVTASPSRNAKGQGSFAVIARGNFDQSRIKAAAQSKGCTVQRFGGVDLLVGANGNDGTAFAFPDVGLAVMGDLQSVKQVLENRANAASLDSALQEEVAKVGGNDAWFASIMPPSAFAAGLDSPDAQKSVDPARVLQSIVRSSGGVRFGASPHLMFNAMTRSAQDATSLADVVRFLASMAQTQRSNGGPAAAFASALDGMKLDTAGSSVHLSLHVPEAVLEQLASPQGNAKMRSELAGPGAR